MPPKQYIYIVMAANIVFDAYTNPSVAYAHARTILGAVVVPCELRSRLPDTVLDDIVMDEYSLDEDTPQIIDISLDDILSKEQK